MQYWGNFQCLERCLILWPLAALSLSPARLIRSVSFDKNQKYENKYQTKIKTNIKTNMKTNVKTNMKANLGCPLTLTCEANKVRSNLNHKWQLLSIKENICPDRHRKSHALQDANKYFFLYITRKMRSTAYQPCITLGGSSLGRMGQKHDFLK